MTDATTVPVAHVQWSGARRIIRSIWPPIDLFEDIADPADWPLLISAEQKTNPRLMETIGNLDLVPPSRRVGGSGGSYLMAPFTHVSSDRGSRFSDGTFGVLYAADRFETALLETMHHHGRFMARTGETAGWASQFRELVLDVDGTLHDLRTGDASFAAALDPDDYTASQALAGALRRGGSQGLVWPSVRWAGGQCVALLFPDLGSNVRQARHLDYHWNGSRVDFYRDAGSGEVYRVG